jgi:hypothetical protein
LGSDQRHLIRHQALLGRASLKSEGQGLLGVGTRAFKRKGEGTKGDGTKPPGGECTSELPHELNVEVFVLTLSCISMKLSVDLAVMEKLGAALTFPTPVGRFLPIFESTTA